MSEENLSEVNQNPSENGNSENTNSDQFGEINKTIQQLGQNQVALQQMLAQQMQSKQNQTTEAVPEQKRVIDDDELESYSRRQFSEHIKSEIVDAVLNNLKPVTEKINSVEENMNVKSLQQQVETARSKYKDFDNYAKDMGMLHNQPQFKMLDVDSLYHIARAKDPSKAYKEPVPEPPPTEKKNEFGGLFPSSAAARDPQRNKSMSRKEAVKAAWDEIFG